MEIRTAGSDACTIFHNSITTGTNTFVGTFLAAIDKTWFEASFSETFVRYSTADLRDAVSCFVETNVGTVSMVAAREVKACLAIAEDVEGVVDLR